jgi:phosphoserine phosphatase
MNPQRKPGASHVLVKVSGQDKPGITSGLTAIIAEQGLPILDISQAVIHRLLLLSILFELEPDSAKTVIKDLLFKAHELDLKLEFEVLEEGTPHRLSEPAKTYHYAVTLIAEQVTARALHEVSSALARWKINIDGIKRLSEADFSCVEMMISSALEIDERAINQELLVIASQQGVDIALQAEGLYRRAKRLVVLDMDSTLIQSEVIDELAREQGVYDEVARITHEAMGGRMDFDESLRKRCAMLTGLTQEDLDRVYRRIELTPGADDLICVLKKLGYKIALISGGFTFVANRLKDRLGIDYAFANTLETRDGKLTGQVIPPIVNAQRKADLVEEIAKLERIELDQVIAIGDGANDLLMLAKAGLGIAFNAKPAVREKADLALSQKNLRSILYLLGLSARDVAQII